MYPDQTAPTREQSDLGPYCLQDKLPKCISRQKEQTTKVVTGSREDIQRELIQMILNFS